MVSERKFQVAIPAFDGKRVAKRVAVLIPMEWDESMGEWLMTEEGLREIERTKARHADKSGPQYLST